MMTKLLLALAVVSSTNPFMASKLSRLVMSKVNRAPIALKLSLKVEPSKVAPSNRPEAFLSCRIPYLKFNHLVLAGDSL